MGAVGGRNQDDAFRAPGMPDAQGERGVPPVGGADRPVHRPFAEVVQNGHHRVRLIRGGDVELQAGCVARPGLDGATRTDKIGAQDAPLARVEREPGANDLPPPALGAVFGVGRDVPIRRNPAHRNQQRGALRSRNLEGNPEARLQLRLQLRLPSRTHVDAPTTGGRQGAGARGLPEVRNAPVTGGRIRKRVRLGRGGGRCHSGSPQVGHGANPWMRQPAKPTDALISRIP